MALLNFIFLLALSLCLPTRSNRCNQIKDNLDLGAAVTTAALQLRAWAILDKETGREVGGGKET